jgi:hypothetical protein
LKGTLFLGIAVAEGIQWSALGVGGLLTLIGVIVVIVSLVTHRTRWKGISDAHLNS